MWSRVILCLFVGLAYATHSPAWNVGKEYTYHVHGRTLALLSGASKEYSGIVFNATLRVQPVTDDKLMCEISEATYSQILDKLPFWNVDSSMDWEWQPLELSSRPFQVEMQNGVITDLVVSKDTPNWEANIIKSIMSQFQLNTKGENIIESPMNILPKAGKNSATYKTMEHTVTGHTETLYSINQMPKYILQSHPRWHKPEKHYNPEEPIIEIVKHKNYTNYIQLPSYTYGLRNIWFQPTSKDQYGSFMSRECLSHALVSGNLDEFTLHTASTTETVATKPLLGGEQGRSSIVSYMHVHLKDLTEQQEKIQAVPSPVRVGNLVYSYAVSHSNPKVRPNTESQESESPEDVESYQIESSPLDQPPQTPLLPFSIGYKGMSIKEKIDIVKQVVKRAQGIANDIEDQSRPITASVMSKFTHLVVLVRLMDVKEMKQAFEQLYTTKSQGPHYYSWVALRDAIGQSGTGPALLTIRELCLSNKISSTEASDLIATISKTVQQPTMEFMRTLFDLIKSPSVQEVNYLNRTAALSYATLIRKVYVSRPWRIDYAFGAQTYGNFATEEGKRFVEDTVVPYFTQQLHQAMTHADTEKIHLAIRCLGNIGHPKILAAFEPYLEGEKQCSPFQRLLMVLALDKIALKKSEFGLPIMYKIYRNVGEHQSVRIAAFYQILRAFNVPSDLLKSMSMYTNIDQHEHVNAAIKSAIESYAELKRGYAPLTQPARAAKPFLNQKTYGAQYGGKQVFEYAMKQLQRTNLYNIETITTEDDRYPKSFEHMLIQNIAGIMVDPIKLQGSTSSFEEIINQFEKLTQWNVEQRQKQQQQQSVRQEPVWSSHNIARLLNMTTLERPQLEGFFYSEIYGYFQAMSFNNHSIEQIPEAIRFYEQQLKDGHKFNTLKFWNHEHLKAAFPTAMGLPFTYVYNQPWVYRAQGNIKASTHPTISEDDKLRVPETLRLKADTTVSVALSNQGVLSFVTPFDYQKYACGFEKIFKAHFPIRGDVDLDLKKYQMRMQYELKNLDGETEMFHYSTWPFTTRINVLSPISIINEPNTKVWRSQNMRTYEQTIGEKETGVALRVKVQRDRKYMDTGRISQIFWTHGPVEALMALFHVDEMQNSRLQVFVVPEKSTSNRIVIHLGGKEENIDESNKAGNSKRSTERETSQRIEEAMKTAMETIDSGRVQGWDLCVEFEGIRSTNYSASAAFAKTFEHTSKSKLVVMLQRRSERSDVKPLDLTLESTNTVLESRLWEVPKAMVARPKLRSQVEIAFGESQDLSKVKGEIEFTRSEERIEYIKRQPVYAQCKREMEEGNKHLRACSNVLMDASRLDDMRIKMEIERLSPEGRHILQEAQEIMTHVLYPNLQIRTLHDREPSKEWYFHARYDPDLKYVNLTAKYDDAQYRINNVAVPEYTTAVLVPSSDNSPSTLLAAKAMGMSYYRPLCVVDKTKISNFNNVTFPADLSKDWTVMFQYVPHQARQGKEMEPVYQQLKHQLRNYVILVRENEYSGKDVKIAFSGRETDYQNLEVSITFDGSSPKILVNGQEMLQGSEQQYKLLYKGYLLLGRESSSNIVIVRLTKEIFIAYDGYRVRLVLLDQAFNNAARGICGQLNQEPLKDFLAPQNCITRDHKKFIKSYELSDEGKHIRKQLSQSNTECVPHYEHLFADVISAEEAQRGQSKDMGECTRFQTLYTEKMNEICFTTRPMPVCKSSCSPRGSISKKVAVHCIANSPVARLWKTQIDKGASPDFSHKQSTKSIPMTLPQKCVQ